MKREFEYLVVRDCILVAHLVEYGERGWQLVSTSGIGVCGGEHIFLREVTP